MAGEIPGQSPKDVAIKHELLIPAERSIIPACDVDTLDHFSRLVEATGDLEGIGGYKVGFELGLTYGLSRVVETAREYTNKPIIYDHQKAGSDIPDTGMNFGRTLARSGIEAGIIFPQAGPETQKRWTSELQDQGVRVMVGLHMTHPRFLVREGGYISDDAPERAFTMAAEMGVRDFIVPGNKVEYVAQYRELLERLLGEGNFDLYAPGFVKQGGKIEDAAKAAGKRWHGIVGSGIYSKEDMRGAAEDLISSLAA